MPVPNSMADLSSLASSNFPTGTESIGNNLDNYLRSHAAIIRSTNSVASATIASASTTDIALADGEAVIITGTATINSLGTGFVGCKRELRFTAALTLVASGNLILPNSANLTVSANDVICFRCIGSGQWILVSVPFNGGQVGRNITVAAGTAPSVLTTSTGGITSSLASIDASGIGFVGTTTNHPLGIFTNNNRVAQFAVNGQMDLTGTFRANGASAGFFQESRNNFGQVWANYAFNDTWRLDVAGVANNRLTVDVSGNVNAAGNIISNSDESLKQDWRPLRDDLVECLAGLKAGEYERKDSGVRQVGVGAQSLERFMPLAVVRGDNDLLSVAYGNAALVGVVALAKRLIALESRVGEG
ncbi:TPA: tail fiber domain-containing protein [Stenotrophomonas maltophilia]|nr:tail fiber domain-containing protein [Stenotrophomonas maltophilia]